MFNKIRNILFYFMYSPPRIIKRDFLNLTLKKWRLGFNPRETWNLDVTFAKFVLPRLKYFRQTFKAIPFDMTEEEWNKELDSMIKAFTIISERFESKSYLSPGKMLTEQEDTKKGLKSFSDYYDSLWW